MNEAESWSKIILLEEKENKEIDTLANDSEDEAQE